MRSTICSQKIIMIKKRERGGEKEYYSGETLIKVSEIKSKPTAILAELE